MSLKDRLKLNEKNSAEKPEAEKNSKNRKNKTEEQKLSEALFKSYIEKDCNILVCCPIEVTTYNALNFLCSKIPQDKRLVGIGTNLLLNPDELIKFEPDTKNLSKDLIKTSLSLNPYKLILQDFQGAEAVDIFKLINGGLKNIITAVCAENAQKAILQAKLNLYLSGLCVPEEFLNQMLNDFFNVIVEMKPSENSDENCTISKIIEIKPDTKKETVQKKSKNNPKTAENKKPDVKQKTADMAPKNILASKLKRKK